MSHTDESLVIHSRRRLVMLATMMLAAASLIAGRLVYWQAIIDEGVLVDDQPPIQALPPRRGAIFDRRGYPLAVETYSYTISAAPNQIADPVETARRVAELLERPMEDIWNAIRDPKKQYALLARNVDIETGEIIAGLNLSGINLTVEPQRTYPNGPLAGHLFGFVNQEGTTSFGLEEYYDFELSGRKGIWGGEALYHRLVPPRNGYDLVLTIDRVIQAMVEEKLAAGVQKNSAAGGTIVVMDPKTGAILAMASYPPFDPNHYATTPEERWANPAVAVQYEPGSVIKVLTLAAGLDAGVVSPDDTYEDTSFTEYGGVIIYNWDRRSHGTTTITRMLQLSLNVGAVHIADSLGAERFYNYLQAFGLGQKTGIDLAGETDGLLRTPRHYTWYPADLATNSFGQGMAITPIQLTAAVAAIANGGKLMRPYVVDHLMNGDRIVRRTEPTVIRQVITEQTARDMTELMTAVVDGHIYQAAVAGYTVAGKTGTAEIPVVGGYDNNDTIASFVGFAPADDPKFVMLVKLNRPDRQRSDWTAAPLFQRIAVDLLRLLGVPPDDVRLANKS
jgi:cell division protein FtsI/penicillin-binding protein 2